MRKITSVVERCNTIATFRRISIWLMETTARWTPITPEMEVKVTLGRHIWEYAQMADRWGSAPSNYASLNITRYRQSKPTRR